MRSVILENFLARFARPILRSTRVWVCAPQRARRYGRWRAWREQAAHRAVHLPEQVLRRRTDSGRGEQPAEGEGLWFDANEALAAFKDTEFKDTEFNSVCGIMVCGRDAKVAIAVKVEKQFCWSSAST